jgi:hypothetical protein
LTPRPRESKPTPGTGACPLATLQNASSHIYHARLPYPAKSPQIFKRRAGARYRTRSEHPFSEHDTERIRTRMTPPRAASSPSASIRSSPDSTHTRIHSLGCIRNFDTRRKTYRARFSRASLTGKNLSQVLENMDSQWKKSTVQSFRQHFVSICTHGTQALRSKKRLVLIPKLTNPLALWCSHHRRCVKSPDTSKGRAALLSD